MTPVASLPAAGRDLDALIAERVMGHPGRFVERIYINDRWWDCKTWLPWEEEPDKPHGGTAVGQMPPRYSTDIEAAWKVVEKMLGTHSVDVNAIPGESLIQWGATMQKMPFIEHNPEHGACAKTAPLAICLAAMEAVGAALKAVAP